MQTRTTHRFHVRIIFPPSRETNSTKTDIPSENTSRHDAPDTMFEEQTSQHKIQPLLKCGTPDAPQFKKLSK